jgi:4-amino-4-deoxy-L-arabinose transferase-like glycosyltransferase
VSVQPYSESEPHEQRESAQEEAGSGLAPVRRPFWLRYAALAFIAALAGLAYAWAANQDNLEPYYAGAVRSMSVSWHNFIFGAVDPAGTISLDKLPGALWLQALAVRAFGFHTWVIILPQMVEGVLTVLVLYRAVSRLSTPTPGLIAAAVVAVSPATVALNRGNISDSLMILLLVLAADSVSAAIAVKDRGGRGTQARLILAGFWVGLAFQAKMIEAWLVLPAFGLAYLLDGPGPLARRVRQLVVAAILAVAAVALLAPGTIRPSETSQGPAASQPQHEILRRIGLAIVSAATTAYAVWLIPANGAHVPGWLVPAIIVVGAAAVVLVIGSALVRRAGLAAAVTAVLVAVLGTPTVASAGLAVNHESAFDTPFESPKVASQLASQPARLATLETVTVPYLQQLEGRAPDLLAAQSSYLAAVYIYVSGQEVLPIGGFTGTIPSPPLSQLKTDMLHGQFHFVVILSTVDPRTRWIASHCQPLRRNRTYYCIPSDAG